MKKLIVQFTFMVLAFSMVFISSVSAATINATDCTVAAIDTAITAASTGDTIRVKGGAACTATWTGTLSLPDDKQILLIGAGIDSTIITGGEISAHCSEGKGHRVSGFTFNDTIIVVQGVCNNTRVDNNKFQYTNADVTAVYFNADTYQAGDVLGLVDNNIFTTTGLGFVGVSHRGNQDWATATIGTANAVYVEHNTFSAGSVNVGSGAIESNRGGRTVFRHNTLTNFPIINHGTYQWEAWPTGRLIEGTAMFEVYDNTINYTSDAYRSINNQGAGEAIIFNNTFTTDGTLTVPMGLLNYRSCCDDSIGCAASLRCDGDYVSDGNTEGMAGYPCFEQAGRKTALALSPHYEWNNVSNGTVTHQEILNFSGCSSPAVTDHIVADRDIYNAVAGVQTSATNPFNGTSGVGFGTLARRPTTCTTAPVRAETGSGVGYFATDQGAQGTLYRCSATDTWTVQYTPYTYPHPLRGDIAGATVSMPGCTISGGAVH